MRGPAAAIAMFVLACLLAACGGGGGGGDENAARAQAARGYAAEVSEVTSTTATALAAIARGADYRDAASAAASTTAYARTIRTAATALDRQEPPEEVLPGHRELVALYRSTSDHMDELATGFASARGERALAEQAQRLSTEVQAYSTKEGELRRSIEAALARVAPSTGGTTAGTATDTTTS